MKYIVDITKEQLGALKLLGIPVFAMDGKELDGNVTPIKPEDIQKNDRLRVVAIVASNPGALMVGSIIRVKWINKIGDRGWHMSVAREDGKQSSVYFEKYIFEKVN